MRKFDIKYTVLLCLFVFAGMYSWRVYFKVYTQTDKISIHNFPREINGWKSRDLKITELEYAILETRNVFVREYVNADTGGKVYLFIVYSENNRKVSHPPEICYTGSGFAIVNSQKDTLKGRDGQVLTVNRLLLELGAAEQIAYYWFKVGQSFTDGYWLQQGKIAFNTLLGRPASSALLRVSADVIGGDYSTAEKTVQEFSADMIPHLLTYLP